MTRVDYMSLALLPKEGEVLEIDLQTFKREIVTDTNHGEVTNNPEGEAS